MNIKKLIKNNLVSGGSLFIASFIAADAMNLLFNVLFVRFFTPEEFGLINFVAALWSLISIFFSALGTTVTHKTAFISAERGQAESVSFYRSIFKKTSLISLILMALWLVASPFFSKFFDVPLPVFLLFGPIIASGILSSVNNGFLQGKLYFSWLALLTFIETFAKIAVALVLWGLHFDSLVYTSIIFSEIAMFTVGMIITNRKTQGEYKEHTHAFPAVFFWAALMTKLSTTSFLLLDVILAKHFLSARVAGLYASLSLVGKMVFYVGALLNNFVVSLISRDEGHKKDPTKTFNIIFIASIVLTLFVYLFIGPLGYITIPLLFGSKTYAIVEFLPLYGLAMALFTLTTQIVTFRLSRRHYIYPAIALLFSLGIVSGMALFHRNIGQIVGVVFISSLLSFIVLFIMNMLNVEGEFVKRNIVDFVEAFLPVSRAAHHETAKKKILIFNWRDTRHAFAGGAEVYIHEIARRWVAKGYYVTVFCGNDGKTPRNEIIDGVEIIRRGGFYFVYVWAFVYYMLRLKGQYDVIIDSENGIPFFTPLYAKEPVYCLMHHVHQHVFRKTLIKPLAMIATFLEETAMPFVYRSIKFITVSDSTRQDMKRIGLGIKGITIIHPGIDLEKLFVAKKHKNPLVLYLGRLKQYKSIDVFLRTIPEIIKKFPKAEFIVAGEGEEAGKLVKLAKKLAIDEHVTFLGKVTEEEKISLYQRAWVFVNPSFMEGWGITTIEANACGTPVVASDVPGLRDSVHNPHSGFLVEYGNVQAFHEKISSLLEDKSLLETMSQGAVAWSQQFTWDKSADKSLKVLGI